MGQIVRLNESLNGTGLQKLVSYDTSKIRDELLKVTTLRGFYDLTDTSSMTLSGGNVSQIRDLSGNNLHFNQVNTANNPTYTASAFGGAGGLSFNGNQHLLANSLFSASKVRTIALFIRARGTGNRIILGKKTATTENIYASNGSIKLISGSVVLKTDIHEYSNINIIGAYDATSGSGYLSADNISTSNISEGITPGVVFADDVYIGRWADRATGSQFVGDIGHVMVFDEDLSKNAAVRNLIAEYSMRKYQ